MMQHLKDFNFRSKVQLDHPVQQQASARLHRRQLPDPVRGPRLRLLRLLCRRLRLAAAGDPLQERRDVHRFRLQRAI